jgi:hypothetical protein
VTAREKALENFVEFFAVCPGCGQSQKCKLDCQRFDVNTNAARAALALPATEPTREVEFKVPNFKGTWKVKLSPAIHVVNPSGFSSLLHMWEARVVGAALDAIEKAGGL